MKESTLYCLVSSLRFNHSQSYTSWSEKVDQSLVASEMQRIKTDMEPRRRPDVGASLQATTRIEPPTELHESE